MDQITLELLSQQFDKLFENGIEFTQFAVTELAAVRIAQYGTLLVLGVAAAFLLRRALKRMQAYDDSDEDLVKEVICVAEIFCCGILMVLALICIPVYGLPWFVSPEGAMINEFLSMAK